MTYSKYLTRVGNHRHFSDPSTVYPPDSGRVSLRSPEATYISAHCSRPPMNEQGNRLLRVSNFPFPADRFIDFESEENVVHAESERRGKHYQKEENWNEF